MKKVLIGLHLFIWAWVSGLVWALSLPVNIENSGWIFSLFFFYTLSSIVILITQEEWAWECRQNVAIVRLTRSFYVASGVFGVWLALFVASSFAPGSSEFYKNRIKIVDVEQSEPSTVNFPDLDVTNAPLVSKDLALRKARVALSQAGDLASQVEVVNMTKQNVGGRLMWVGFLQPTGFFRWLDLDGSPGYITVSASDESDVQFVREIGGEQLALRYTSGAWFGDEAARKIRSAVGLSQDFVDLSEEIDDQGRPFIVASLVSKDFFGHGRSVTGVVVLDVQTGEVKQYSVDEAPVWVDIVQPDFLVQEQLEDAGEFAQGRFNFSDAGKFKVGELDQVYSTDGNSYYVGPIRSYKSTDGVTGFVFVDTQTGQATRYALSGTGEDNARAAGENSFPGRQFESSNPIPFNVGGTPTYVMTLSKGETVFAYALVSIENSTQFGVGESITEAYTAYATRLSKRGLSNELNSALEVKEGRVDRIMQDSKSGDFKILLSGDDVVITVPHDASPFVFVTKQGDEIKVSGTAYGQRLFNATMFSNTTLEGQGAV